MTNHAVFPIWWLGLQATLLACLIARPTSSTRLAQGARPKRVVRVGVGGMVMVVPSTMGVVVLVGMPVVVGMVVIMIVVMGMAAHR